MTQMLSDEIHTQMRLFQLQIYLVTLIRLQARSTTTGISGAELDVATGATTAGLPF